MRAALAGDTAAGERILRDTSSVAWTACRYLTRTDLAASEALSYVLERLQADQFRCLRPYDGRSRLTTFMSLLVRELLAERFLKLLETQPHQAWIAFEGLFGESIAGVIRRRLPGSRNEDLRRDAYQEVSLGLVANEYRRLKGYCGGGSFGGYLLQIVDRLTLDFMRRLSGRLRLPATIARLTALEQAIYKRIYWDGAAPEIEVLCAALSHLSPRPTPSDVKTALETVHGATGAGHTPVALARPKQISLTEQPELAEGPSAEGRRQTTPEEELITREEDAKLRAAIGKVPEPEHTYLLIKLRDDLPPREIARLMGLPPQEIYKIGQRALILLKKAYLESQTEKQDEMSV